MFTPAYNINSDVILQTSYQQMFPYGNLLRDIFESMQYKLIIKQDQGIQTSRAIYTS